jgi:hypothetical protein
VRVNGRKIEQERNVSLCDVTPRKTYDGGKYGVYKSGSNERSGPGIYLALIIVICVQDCCSWVLRESKRASTGTICTMLLGETRLALR